MRCHPEQSEGSAFLYSDVRILRQPARSRSFAPLRMTAFAVASSICKLGLLMIFEDNFRY
jgi:hypothetical protein